MTSLRPGSCWVPIRQATTSSASHKRYEAVVVGAGPAGITAVGNLLENRVEPILWVDREFNGGRVNGSYREVPSNTKVKMFVDFATAVAPFRKIVSNTPSRSRWEEPSPSDSAAEQNQVDKLQEMRKLDQEKGCQLSHAADMCLMLTSGLRQTPGVVAQQGSLAEATLDESSSRWMVRLDGDDPTIADTKRLVLCTGSTPLDPPLPVDIPVKHMNLDTALTPSKLSQILSRQGPTTVAVIGASHSAVLVLRNLANLALSSKPDLKVLWFTRHPLRYAEYEADFIALDNTGLKGEAAVWARENLESDAMPHSPISKCTTKIAYEKGTEPDIYAEYIPKDAFVVQAIGFERNTLPTLRVSGAEKPIEPRFDHDQGLFSFVKEVGGDPVRLPGLYGAGIAFPQRIRDKKYGHEELNVGFFKFMKAVKQWVPQWK